MKQAKEAKLQGYKPGREQEGTNGTAWMESVREKSPKKRVDGRARVDLASIPESFNVCEPFGSPCLQTCPGSS
eukprot:6212025-Pleurochrysis_carterae.AAC.2